MHNLKHKLIPIALLSLTLGGCQFNSTRTNMAGDRKDAEKVTDKFHEFIKAKNYDSVYTLFSKRFFAVTPKAKMTEILTATQNKLGDLKSDSLAEWQTRIVEGTNPSSEYVFQYSEHHQKYDAKEQFNLTKEADGKIRILGYNINSEGFFK